MTSIAKWGNSLAVRIPRDAARKLALDEGTEIEVTVEDGSLVVRPSKPVAYDLDALLSRITPDNLHPETMTGTAVGDEG